VRAPPRCKGGLLLILRGRESLREEGGQHVPFFALGKVFRRRHSLPVACGSVARLFGALTLAGRERRVAESLCGSCPVGPARAMPKKGGDS
jgi:hypothetical protein